MIHNLNRPQVKQPLPPHAKQVFSGTFFDVYTWEQECFDGQKRIFEQIRRRDVVVVIAVTADDKIIVTDQEQPGLMPFTCFPGGHIDTDESVLDAAKRELLEETGHQSDSWSQFYAVQPSRKMDWTIYYLVARSCTPTQEQKLDGAEKIKIRKLDFENFVELAVSPSFSEIDIRVAFLEAKAGLRDLADLRRQILSK